MPQKRGSVPTVRPREEDALLLLFLSAYEDRTWGGELSTVEYPERVRDGGVELIATQRSTGRTLAIEHTVVEPFVGEKRDFHAFKALAEQLKADDALKEPGVALYVDAPVGVLPKKVPWPPIIDEVKAFLRREAGSFGPHWVTCSCPCPSHPQGTIVLRVRRQVLERTTQSLVIVRRHGEMHVIETVRRALERKLPKLAATEADCRILMLECDQGFVYPEQICADVESLRPEYPGLAQVHQLWICDTATFGTPRE